MEDKHSNPLSLDSEHQSDTSDSERKNERSIRTASASTTETPATSSTIVSTTTAASPTTIVESESTEMETSGTNVTAKTTSKTEASSTTAQDIKTSKAARSSSTTTTATIGTSALKTTKSMTKSSIKFSLKCSICNLRFPNESEMDNHLGIGGHFASGKSVICDQCPFMTSSKDELLDHGKSHYDGFNLFEYLCNTCSFKSAGVERMRMHLISSTKCSS